MRCRLCDGADLKEEGVLTLSGGRRADYVTCLNCDLLQVVEPSLAVEYKGPSPVDTGAVLRSTENASKIIFIHRLMSLSPSEPCLDYGGGTGLLVRRMRDLGLPFYWHDKYGENIFARGFDKPSVPSFEFLTALEVWEHLIDVKKEIEEEFSLKPKVILVSTELHEGFHSEWDFLSLETGQHVSFFSKRTMRYLAQLHGYDFIASRFYTLFTREKPSSFRRSLLLRVLEDSSRLSRLAVSLYARPYPTLVVRDYQKMKAQVEIPA